jgi:hypothetical protein
MKREEALHGVSLCIGWQLIHDYLVWEGCARKWSTPFNDNSLSLAGWRDGNPMDENIDEIDNLAI